MAEGWRLYSEGPRPFWYFAGFPAPHGFFGQPFSHYGKEPGEEPAAGRYVTEALERTYLRRFPRVAHLKQVHGDGCLIVRKERPLPAPPEEGDALVTSDSDILLRVKTADCVPVVLTVPSGLHVAAAHAGWRGACRGILARAVEALQGEVSAEERGSVFALIGPCIRTPHYEVKQDFLDEASAYIDPAPFVRYGTDERGNKRLTFDLPALALRELQAAGVARVEDCGVDTYPLASGFRSRRRTLHAGDLYNEHNDSVIAPAAVARV